MNINLNHFSLPFNFNKFLEPGIYAIVNTKTNKYYIGEANNLADRFARHILVLNSQNQKHDCITLQEDWDLYGEQVFDFIILEIGKNPWSDRIKRLQSQQAYIEKYKNNLYNIAVGSTKKRFAPKPTRNSIPVIAQNEEFNRINEAARYFNVSYSTMRGRINDPNDLNYTYKYPNKRAISTVARAIVVSNRYYESVSMPAAQKGISEGTVRKNIKTKSDWNYFDKLSDIDKKAIFNLKEEIKTSNIGKFKSGRLVQVDQKIFPSINQAAKAELGFRNGNLFSIDHQFFKPNSRKETVNL